MGRTTSKMIMVAFITLTLSTLAGLAQSASVPKDENSAMEKYASSLGLRSNVHSWPKNPRGGIRGVTTMPPSETPDLRAATPPLPYRGPDEFNLHQKTCRSAAVVIAKDIGSSVAITSDQTFIYTKHQFQVIQILKPLPGIDAASLINVVQIGGTIVDGGEKLSLDFYGAHSFVEGQSYLLFLTYPSLTSPRNLFIPEEESETIRVNSNRIFFAPPEFTHPSPFVSGESAHDAADQIARSMVIAPCDRK
jgi:hypothetical protein